MTAKRPRRTAERILDVTLAMFNRFGEPNVSTGQLCGELGISPGNLFYHHPTREALVSALYHRYGAAAVLALASPGGRPTTPMAAVNELVALCERLARVAWDYRFLFRDLDDLVSRHRDLEEGLPPLLRRQAHALHGAMAALPWADTRSDGDTRTLWCGLLLSCLTGTAGLDGALDPREVLRGDGEQAVTRALVRGLGLIRPALRDDAVQLLDTHLSRGAELRADPWWLAPPRG